MKHHPKEKLDMLSKKLEDFTMKRKELITKICYVQLVQNVKFYTSEMFGLFWGIFQSD